MLLYENRDEGLPPRLYRSPSEIKRDVERICAEIRKSDEMLSVRNILLEMISEQSIASPEKWIPELEETVTEARCALERIKRLNTALDDLYRELEESRCTSGF